MRFESDSENNEKRPSLWTGLYILNQPIFTAYKGVVARKSMEREIPNSKASKNPLVVQCGQ